MRKTPTSNGGVSWEQISRLHGQQLKDLQKPWRIIREAAGLEDVRIHDLRHSFTGVAVAAGGSLSMIGNALGHSNPITTQRYVHLADDPVSKLSEATARSI